MQLFRKHEVAKKYTSLDELKKYVKRKADTSRTYSIYFPDAIYERGLFDAYTDVLNKISELYNE